VRTWAVFTGRLSLGVRTFNPVLTGWFSVKTGASFGCPTLVSTIGSSFWTILEQKNCRFW
jgi:hypothetical protein